MYTLKFLYLVAFLDYSCGVTSVHSVPPTTTEAGKVRLSDFPVIKRWEIPLKANVVGRRHKDLFAENNKKRSFWEAKPQFTLHELEADEDPEKIYMDLHYSRNMLEEDSDDKPLFTSKKKNVISTSNKKRGQREEVSQQKKIIAHQSGDKKRLIALKPFLSAKHVNIANKKKRKRRHRRSIEEDDNDKEIQDALMEDENLTENNINNGNIDNGDERLKRSAPALMGERNLNNNNNDVEQERRDKERAKRSSPSLADFYFDQYYDNNNQMSGEESETIHAPTTTAENADTQSDVIDTESTNQQAVFIESQQKQRENEEEVTNDRQKRSIIISSNTKQQKANNNRKIASASAMKEKRTPHEENLSKIFKKTGSPSTTTSNKAHSSSSSDSKRSTTSIKTSDATTTDQQKRAAKALIQKAFFSTSKHGSNRIVPAPPVTKNTVRHIIPQSSSSTKHAILPEVDVKFVTKSISATTGNNVEMTSLKKNSDVGIRQQIAHPLSAEDGKNEKSTDSINTANVARAVAVAMEQLKRDKMWGKVFVHVRPTGELKVMVQETKKMEE